MHRPGCWVCTYTAGRYKGHFYIVNKLWCNLLLFCTPLHVIGLKMYWSSEKPLKIELQEGSFTSSLYTGKIDNVGE